MVVILMFVFSFFPAPGALGALGGSWRSLGALGASPGATWGVWAISGGAFWGRQGGRRGVSGLPQN